MTADLWSGLPAALNDLSTADAVRLMNEASDFLEFGGSVTLNFVLSGSDVLRQLPTVFGDWVTLSRMIAKSGNAVLISFLRATPRFFASFARRGNQVQAVDIQRVLTLTAEIAENDAESALAAFKSSAEALTKVSINQLDEWV